MRAITVRQPWAWAIVHGGKVIENRGRNIAGSYRGPVAIHAGLTRDSVVTLPAYLEALGRASVADRMRVDVFGAILGVVDLVEVHRGWPTTLNDGTVECCGSPWAEVADAVEEERGRGVVHLTVAHPRPLATPIPYRGALGLWTIDDATSAEIDAQLAAQV